MPSSNRSSRLVWWLAVIGFLLIVMFAFLGMLRCRSGRQLIWNLHASGRSALINVPLSRRDHLHTALDTIDAVFNHFTLFYFGSRGSRLKIFHEMHEFTGKISPFAGGIAVNDHADVLEVLESANQPRGNFLGARWPTDKCFGAGFQIFQSTGPEHAQTRQFMLSVIHGLSANHSGFRSDLLPAQSVAGDSPKSAVEREVVRNLWWRFFGEKPSAKAETAMMQYFDHELACKMGVLNTLTGNFFVSRMPEIRATALKEAQGTKVGALVLSRATSELGKTPEQALKLLETMLEGFLYSGLLGVSHVTRSSLDRIQMHPATYVPMWLKDPASFLLESARLDPPVTSVTSLLTKDTTIDVASGFFGNGYSAIHFEKGTTVQLVLANANVDPAVFGGPARSPVVAQMFNPERPKAEKDMILSWNGMLSKVQHGTATRGCPGMLLSSDLASKLIARHVAAQCSEDVCDFGSVFPARDVEPWYERLPLALSPISLSVFSEADSFLNNELAFGLLGVVAALSIGVIKFWHGYGHMSGLWCELLTSLLVLCAGRIWRLEVLVHHAAIRISLLYIYMAFLAASHVQNATKNTDKHTLTGAIRKSIEFTSVHWACWTGSMILHAVFLVIEVQTKTFGDSDYPYFDFLVYTILLFTSGIAPILPLLQLGSQEQNAVMKPRIMLAPAALTWMAANCVWPQYLQDGLFATLYTCIANIPPMMMMITAVTTIDDRLWLGNLVDIRAMEQQLLRKNSGKVSTKGMTIEDFKAVGGTLAEFKKFDTNHDGMLNHAEFKASCEAQLAKVQSKVHGSRKTGLRLGIALGIVMFAATLIVPNVHEALTGAKLCFFEIDQQRYPEECLQGASAMELVDRHTRSLYRTLKVLATPRNESGLIDEGSPFAQGSAVTTPTYQIKLPKKSLVYCHKTSQGNMDARCSIPTQGDNTDGIGSQVSTVLFNTLRNNLLYQLVDVSTRWLHPEQAPNILKAGSKEELKILELYPWDEMQSDEAISRFCFAGIAAHRTQAVVGDPEIAYKNEWAWMVGFEVRPGFELYGANAYFDKEANLVKMYWAHKGVNVTVGHKDWDHVKWAFKCTVLAGATVKDHLVGIHFMASNFLTTSSIENLNPLHPIRRLIRPHTFGAIEINLGAVKTLAVEGGTAHRASALTWKGLQDALAASYKLTRYLSLSKTLGAAGMRPTVQADAKKNASQGIFPYGRDGEAFFGVVAKAVGAYVDVYYPDDASVTSDAELTAFWDGLHIIEVQSSFPLLSGKEILVDTISTYITLVTAIHNQVGNVADYLINPTYASAKIRPGATMADVQGTFQGLNIGLMTSQITPRLLNDFKHLLLQDEHREQTGRIFDQFQADLRALSAEIDELNEKRRFPCNAFNPKTMVAAVSI